MIDTLSLVSANPMAVHQQPQVLSATYAGYDGRVMPRTDPAVVQSVAIRPHDRSQPRVQNSS
jgi:hypothetical protein